MREALAIEIDGLLLHGTRHRPPTASRRGILFLNSGAQPRSSRGDLNVRLADALADHGYDCFRFDLPGLGDSEGDAPEENLDFYIYVEEGGYAGCVAKLTQALLDCYRLDDVVLTGICGGALSSVYAAVRLGAGRVAGLILLDFPFYAHRAPSAAPNGAASALPGRHRVKAQTRRVTEAIHDWILEQAWEPRFTRAYRSARRLGRILKGHRLPGDANPKALDALAKVLKLGIPVLLVTPAPPSAAPLSFDYIRYVRQWNKPQLQHLEIAGTTHSFVENGGGEAVRTGMTEWLAAHVGVALGG